MSYSISRSRSRHNRNGSRREADSYSLSPRESRSRRRHSYHSSHHGYSSSYKHSHSKREHRHTHHHRHRAHSRRHGTTSYSHKNSHYSHNDDSEKDDSIGHFLGGEGDIIGGKLDEIVKELGTGTFARAFEAKNLETKEYCAVKVVRAIPRYCRHAKIEASIMRDIAEKDPQHKSHCSYLMDEFEYKGHYCMVMPLLGDSMYMVLKDNEYKPFPMSLLRDILRELFEALQFLHHMGLTHTDLKLENVLFATQEKEVMMDNDLHQRISVPNTRHIAVIDYGSATYSDERRKGTINTRQYRAPEVLLGMEWDEESDIWGVACIAMELFTGDLLFQTHGDALHFALIEKIVGKVPERMIRALAPGRRQLFDEEGHFLGKELHREERERVREQRTLKEMVGKNYPNFLDLMESCLIIAPSRRITAAEALMHPFFSGKD